MEQDGSRKIVTDKKEIEEAIGRLNVTRLQQAHNTLLREEPLRTMVGEEGKFEIWNKLMENEIKIPDKIKMNKGTRLWFQKIHNF